MTLPTSAPTRRTAARRPCRRPRRRTLTAAALGVLLILAAAPAYSDDGATPSGPPTPPVAKTRHDTPQAPVLGRPSGAGDRYVVVLRDPTAATGRPAARVRTTARTAVRLGATIGHTYDRAIHGFSATLTPAALTALRADPRVAYLEHDQLQHTDGDETNPPWGLDRIDQRTPALNGHYLYDTTGDGVTAYIIDSGINYTHTEFTGRIGPGRSFVSDSAGDCLGHGSHVAGTIGGTQYGVAKQVTLVPLKVFGNCEGSAYLSDIIAAIDWMIDQHAAGTPAVANMSLGATGFEQSESDAVNAAVNDGIVMVVAAGNDNHDACRNSPASIPAAITVAATDSGDRRADFSNYGSCVDLFAPGVSVTSAWKGDANATNTIDGTSMATPHVAGTAALYLQTHPTATPAEVAAWLTGTATTGVIGDPAGSPNLLLHTGATGTPPPPPPAGTNLLSNPGFENGSAGWAASTYVVTNSSRATAHNGSWYAWLCGYGKKHKDQLATTVTLPAGDPQLSFYLWLYTTENSGVYDRLQLKVTPAGGTTHVLATWTNQDWGSDYVQRTFSLAAYAGQTVTIRFTGKEDRSNRTGYLIDDVFIG